ncbi:nucleolar protein dao-5-like isoform X1 [Haliotis rufescens]|uniref:nucleolar protein dao-5-like isoform X1 n=2 Tax=Haliotis rufescens TaxID=6454 RepID=UPI00201E821E|nr:nucleolar protein dao-5-like isoform X1 [Haliotis rufescens]
MIVKRKMSSKHTPRNLIQQYADNVATEKSTHPARKRRPVSQSPTVGSSSKPVSKRQRAAIEEDLTPRHLIQGFIDTQDTAIPSTRKSKRVGELPPPSSTKVKKSRRRSSLGIPSMEKVVNQFTPRTMITGLLDQGVEQTPEFRAAKGDKSVARSSLGDLPNNEISFQPVEASFHENKLTKQSQKTRGGRQRLPINIVRRRSDKLAKQQRTGKELEFSTDEEEEYSAEEQTVEIGRDANRSRRKSAHSSLQDVSDTSAKDDTSAAESPRKSLSRSRVTPSKRLSMASLKNASRVTPSRSLSMSRVSDAHLSPGRIPKLRTPRTTRSPRTGTPRSNRRSGNVSLSPRPTVSKSKVKSANATERAGGDMIADVEEDIDSVDEGSFVAEDRSASKSKSRIDDDVQLDSADAPYPTDSKLRRDDSLDSASSKHDESSRPASRASFSRSRSRVEEEGHSSPSRGDASVSGLGSNSKSNLSVKERPTPKSRSMSKSKLAKGSDNEDGDTENDDQSSHMAEDTGYAPYAPTQDEPRSGRSSPRYTTGLVDNVYDFHDDSPSKRIIGKLVQTLQQSASAGDRGQAGEEDISDQEEESRQARDHHAGTYHNVEESDDEYDDDDFHGEPEESIIPAADGETHEYYTPLRTPHLKKKQSSRKPLPVVTSTPKPGSVQQGEQAKQKGRKKPAQQKKLSSSYMPTSVVKGLFSHFCPAKVSKDAIAEVEKASAQFWENAAKDLESYALHAHRKTIEEADVELLMKRQKFVTPKESLYCLVEKYLPLELRQEIIPISRSGNKLELK